MSFYLLFKEEQPIGYVSNLYTADRVDHDSIQKVLDDEELYDLVFFEENEEDKQAYQRELKLQSDLLKLKALGLSRKELEVLIQFI